MKWSGAVDEWVCWRRDVGRLEHEPLTIDKNVRRGKWNLLRRKQDTVIRIGRPSFRPQARTWSASKDTNDLVSEYLSNARGINGRGLSRRRMAEHILHGETASCYMEYPGIAGTRIVKPNVGKRIERIATNHTTRHACTPSGVTVLSATPC